MRYESGSSSRRIELVAQLEGQAPRADQLLDVGQVLEAPRVADPRRQLQLDQARETQ
jgi:hypothetical protein